MFYPPLIGYLIVAVVCALLVFAIRNNRLGRNRVIGIRSRHTLRSDVTWEVGHRAAGPKMIAIAIIAFGFAIGLLAVELFDWPTAVGNVLAVSGWVPVLGGCAAAWAVANRAAKSADD